MIKVPPVSPPGCFKRPPESPPACPCLSHSKQRPLHHTLAVVFAVLGYSFVGAVLFMVLEGEPSHQETSVAASKHAPSKPSISANSEIRSQTVERLWAITEDLNILYRENWTRLAAREVLDFQERLLQAVRRGGASAAGLPGGTTGASLTGREHPHRWSYASAFLYSVTLITTIGYGAVSPRTPLGRAAAVLYALGGIPLALCYLSASGEALAGAVRRIAARLGAKHHPDAAEKRPLQGPVRVPISLCLLAVGLYVALGVTAFSFLEGWSVLEGIYFCFTSLGTIGFGDLVPGHGPLPELSLYVCSAYVLIGMAVIATSFNLMQTEVALWLRKFGVKEGGGPVVEDISLVSVGVHS